jgi:hypothetical protein
MFMEMIKTMSISFERFVITNIELIKEYEQKEKHHALASIMQAGIG